MPLILIGVDDTDMPDTPGTGKLARQLSGELVHRGARHLGTTAHQFLIDDRIPYTGHNRGICIAIEWHAPIEQLAFTFDLIRDWSAEGSDPGVCIAAAVPPPVITWSRSAMQTVRTMDEATSLARAAKLNLHPLGGTGQGIIGALASVGLHAGGEDGRFVDLPGLRELGETVTPQQLAKMGIQIEHRNAAGTIPRQESAPIYKTLGWVRPTLRGGKPLWSVEWSDEHDAWISINRKKTHSLE